MYQITIERHPNDELRCVLSYSGMRRPSPHLSLEKNSKRSPKAAPAKGSTKAAGYGRLGRPSRFSNYARRKLLRCGAAFDQIIPSPEEALFLTGTLPGSTQESFRAIAEYSGWLVQRLKAWIAKRQRDNLSMYVWEYQKRGALHLHYVVYITNDNAREYIKREFKAEWIRLLTTIGKKTGVDMWKKTANYTHANNKEVTRTDAQSVKKSVGRYMSKYMSKTRGINRGFANKYAPSRWYGISRPLLAAASSMTSTLKIEVHSLREALAIREEYKHTLDSSEGLSYSWRCRAGVARVDVLYSQESRQLWEGINAYTRMKMGQLMPQSASSGILLRKELLLRFCKMIPRESPLELEFTRYSGEVYLKMLQKWRCSRSLDWKDEVDLIQVATGYLSYLSHSTPWILTSELRSWLAWSIQCERHIVDRQAEVGGSGD